MDLTDNKLGNRGAIEITQLIEHTTTIERLNLSKNRIGPSGLQHICSALTVNKSIKYLDITDNMVQDESYKILLAMLFRNPWILNIKYSLTNEENQKRLEKFKQNKHLPLDELEEKLNDSTVIKPKSWMEKLCFPVLCWKSFIHDKHEAFRFKYDTNALNLIENEMMDKLTLLLYINSMVYYIIMFVCPIVFVNECGEGMNIISHIIYLVYSLTTVVIEVAMVIKIQNKVQNKNILKFNKWHVVELFMGQIARFDTYLDVCFLSLLWRCEVWNLVIPVGLLILLYIMFPLYNLFRLARIK